MSDITTKEKKQNTKSGPKSQDLLVAKVVRTVLSNSRHATAKTKKRGEISGGGKKPWKQKGTGRARAGSSRSPLWRGGGIVFGPNGSQNYNIKASKKEKQLAVKQAFEQKKSATISLDAPKISKTKEAADFLKKNEIKTKTLILLDVENKKGEKESKDATSLKRAFKNIPEVAVMYRAGANAYDVLNSEAIIILKMKKNENNVTPRQAQEASKTEGKVA